MLLVPIKTFDLLSFVVIEHTCWIISKQVYFNMPAISSLMYCPNITFLDTIDECIIRNAGLTTVYALLFLDHYFVMAIIRNDYSTSGYVVYKVWYAKNTIQSC